jgi:hypothetical protein
MSFVLDYDRWIHLDAENLAETGMHEAYERLLPELRKYVPHPARIEEVIDNDTPLYSVRCGPKEYAIYGAAQDDENGNSWGRATFAFFSIVNDQLADSENRFFAINGGNDLGGHVPDGGPGAGRARYAAEQERLAVPAHGRATVVRSVSLTGVGSRANQSLQMTGPLTVLGCTIFLGRPRI